MYVYKDAARSRGLACCPTLPTPEPAVQLSGHLSSPVEVGAQLAPASSYFSLIPLTYLYVYVHQEHRDYLFI